MNKDLAAEAYATLSKGYAMLAQAVLDSAPAAIPSAVTPEPVSPPAPGPVPAAGGDCVIHGMPWRVVPAGVSKAGKPYGAFAACPEQGCRERPTAAWYAAHPLT
jgi:hypothetical protein